MKSSETMKRYSVGLILMILSYSVQSQISRMFFVSGGMSIFSDIAVSESSLDTRNNNTFSYQHMQWNYGTLIFDSRMNIANISENATLSLSLKPSLGFGIAYPLFDGGTWYSVATSIPAFFQFNYGAASRFQAKNDFGFVLGCGYEYNMSPIYGYAISETDLTFQEFQKKWNQLVFEFGIRYWNKKNRVNEVNAKIGLGEKGQKFVNADNRLVQEKQAMSVRVSFLRIINY